MCACRFVLLFGLFKWTVKWKLTHSYWNGCFSLVDTGCRECWFERYYQSWHRSNRQAECKKGSAVAGGTTKQSQTQTADQAPVPLSIFRSNSKFDENSERSSFKYIRLITTIFCTRHDSDTVVTCAKYRCDRPRIFYTRVFWIFIEFRIRSKYA